MSERYRPPAKIAESFIETSRQKAQMSPFRQLLFGVLAGAYIALAAQGSNMAIHTIQSAGPAKALAGAIFTVGLIVVVVAGAELFTGNCLMIVGLCRREIKLSAMLRNWGLVYLGNLIGALIIVLLIAASGQLNTSGNLLAAFTIKVAAYKTALSFGQAFSLAILCNWLVCLAVWMAAGARDIAGKILAVFFPVWLFVASGFEHSVANMYYIPAGILAKSHEPFVQAAMALGVDRPALEALNWGAFVQNNLLPVTLGNIVGGGVFVAVAYSLLYLRKKDRASG
jgi:formate/nitrite transporter